MVDVEERRIAEARVLLLAVESGFDLVRVKGRLRERVGTGCVSMTPEREARVREERRNYDWSSEQSELGLNAVSELAVEEARRQISRAADAESIRRASLSQEDLLREMGLVHEGGNLTRAGAVLLCRTPDMPSLSIDYLRKRTPAGELSRPPTVLRAPLLVALAELLDAIDAINETTPVTLRSGVQQHLETIPAAAVREAVVNAIAHRDYRLPDPIVVEHSPATLAVVSPGGFVFGVSEHNILTHVSKPRNRALAEALRVLRLAEKAGTGVDLMVRAMIGAGHMPPEIRGHDGSVRVVLNGGAPVARIASVIAELPADVREDTDVALVIHYLRTHATVDAPIIAPVIQKTELEAQEVLRRLSDDRLDLIEPTREKRRSRMPEYRFRERVRAELGTLLGYHRHAQDEIDRRIIEHLREYGSVSNQTVQNLFQVGVYRASAILRDLADREVIKKTEDSPARGPTVRWEPGAKFPAKRKRR